MATKKFFCKMKFCSDGSVDFHVTLDALQAENKKLKRELAKRDLIIAECYALLEDRDAVIAKLAADVAAMQKVIAQMMAQRRGGVRVPEGQGLLFSEAEREASDVAADAPSNEAEDEESDGQTNKQRAKGTKRTPGKLDTTGLPRKREIHDLPEDQRIDPVSGKALVVIGERVTEELNYQRGRLDVTEHVQLLYGLPPDEAEHRKVAPKAAPVPPKPFENCIASAVLLAWILVQKYCNHRVPRRHAQPPQGGRSKSCCIEDEGWPLGIGVQALVSIHLVLRGSRARVVSVEGNGAARPRQERSKKTSASEPLITCREVSTRRRNRAGWLARDESRGYLITDWMASGMKAA